MIKLLSLLVVVAGIATANAAPKFCAECTVCDLLWTAFHDVVISEEGFEKSELIKVCNDLPAPLDLLSDTCIQLVNQYWDTVLQDAFNWESMHKLCNEQLNVCPCSSSANYKLKDLLTGKAHKSNPCATCKMIVPFIKSAIGDMDPHQLTQQICQYLHEDSICPTVVGLLLEYIVEVLDESPEQICTDIGVCSASKMYIRDLSTRSPQCSLCAGAVDVLKWLLDQSWLQAELQNKLQILCALMPPGYVAPCQQTVQQYFQQMLAWLEQHIISNNAICGDLLGCAKKSTNLFLGNTNNKWGVDVCGLLQNMENNVPTLVHDLAGICSAIPDPTLQQQCNSAFANNQAQIIQVVTQAIQFIANKIPFVHCNIQPPQAQIDLPDFISALNLNSRSPQCSLCSGAVDVLKWILDQSWLQSDLQARISSLCYLFPSDQVASCQQTVQLYFSQMLAWLEQHIITNNEICGDLLGCSKKSTNLFLGNTNNKWGVDVCGLLQNMENNVPTLVHDLAGICSAIPDPTLQQQCNSAFANNQAQIVQVVTQAIQFIANKIPFVHCNITPPQGQMLVCDEDQDRNGTIVCTLCTDFFTDIQNIITDPTLEAEIINTVKEDCRYLLNQVYVDACKNMIDTYGKTVFSTIAAFLDPKSVCPTFGLCPSSP